MKHGVMIFGCVLAIALLLSGCATPSQVGDQAVTANAGQEQAHNKTLLLNVVRAYHRMPMHFSKVSAVRLPLGLGNPTFTLPTPFGPDFTTQIYGLSTQLGIQQGLDTIPLDSQEFMQGITTPVSPSLMLYYLDQGWPQQLILHMFVRSVEIYDDKDELIQRITNYPQNLSEFAAFQSAMDNLRGCEFDAKVERSRSGYGPIYRGNELGNAQALAAAKTAELVAMPVDAEGNETDKKPVGLRFFRETRSIGFKVVVSPVKPKETCTLPGMAQELTVTTEGKARGAVSGKKTAVFLLRSPEAMIYYLGEIARAQLDERYGGTPPSEPSTAVPTMKYRGFRATGKEDSYALFTIKKSKDSAAPVSVEYEGEHYSVPKGSTKDRSTHVLSLITQIMGLQNKGTAAPTTANVRLLQ